MSTEQLLPAEVGPYRILRRLGQGGMGEVYEALHKSIERRVAIKVLRPRYAADPELTSRFFNEARAVNLIEHPGIVQVSDYGRQDDGSAYIVMEYLRGETLGTRLARCGGRLPASEAVRISRQIASALLAAHEKGIVHRDMKPENVMLVESPDPDAGGRDLVKILDFGIAKLAGPQGEAQPGTRTGLVLGTPLYMSPEQCRGAKQVDALTDVYSLGVMLYRMLSGEYPLHSDEEGQVLAMQIYESPRPLLEVAPHVDGGLAQLVHRMLCKDRASRIRMAEVIASLEHWTHLTPASRNRDGPAVSSRPSLGATAEAATRADATVPAERTAAQTDPGRVVGAEQTLQLPPARASHSATRQVGAVSSSGPREPVGVAVPGGQPDRGSVSTVAAQIGSPGRHQARRLALLTLGLAGALWAGQRMRSQAPVSIGPVPASPAPQSWSHAAAKVAGSAPPEQGMARPPEPSAVPPPPPEPVALSVRSEPAGALAIRPADATTLGRLPVRDAASASADRGPPLLRLPQDRDKLLKLPGRKNTDALVRPEPGNLPRSTVRPTANQRRASQPVSDEPEILE